MEEDIKFIEKMIKEYKTFGDLDNPDFENTEKIYKAIENLLKAYKEDEAVIEEMAKYIKEPYEVRIIGTRKSKIEIIKEYFRNKVKGEK